MHILHTIDSLQIGGAERMLVEIANQTVRDGHQVSVCATRLGGPMAKLLHSDIYLLVLNRQKRFDLHALLYFIAWLKSAGIDIIHVHSRSTLSFLLFLKSFYPNLPPILMHDHFGRIEIDPHKPFWFRLFGSRLVSAYVGVYEKLADWAKEAGVSEKKISVIGNALDLTPYMHATPFALRKHFDISEKTAIGIVVAGIRYEKGIDILLSALTKIPRELDYKIIVIGKSNDSEYSNTCQSSTSQWGLDEKVILWGERPDVPNILRGADFAVVPSRSESGPLVLIEYAACGLPFVATQVGNVSRQMKRLGVVKFVPPDNHEALAEAIIDLLKMSPAERAERGRQGREAACECFDISKKMERWYEVYQKILADQRY